MSNTPCQNECKYLKQLADRLRRSIPENNVHLQTWEREADQLLQHHDLETLQGEMELEKLSLRLRTIWLRHANSVSSRYLKSPPHFRKVQLPSGEINPFPYDRWNKPITLETRAVSYRRTPADWTTEHVFFNSGMGAVVCALHVTRNMYKPTGGTPLKLDGIGGYFEIMDLMQETHDELFQLRIFQNQQEFLRSVGTDEAQILYIEPVYTQDGNLHVFNLDKFMEAWHQRSGKIPTTLVLDTTFTGNRFPVREFAKLLEPNAPRVILQISSTLKLDQEGLEFSNAGLMSIYSSTEEISIGIGKRMRKSRAAMGLGLTLEQISALDYPGFLDPAITEQHANAVYSNNERLAHQLETGPDNLFIGKSHPALQGKPDTAWAVAPFVNVHLDPQTDIIDRELLKHVIFKESQKRKVIFYPGSSFGFRAHRVETSIQNEHGTQVIRVAMGCRNGPSTGGTIQLLNDISQMQNFSAIRHKYPDLLETVRKFSAQTRNPAS